MATRRLTSKQNGKLSTTEPEIIELDQSPDVSSDEAVYDVEEILAHRIVNGQLEYQLKWAGYADPSWEPHANIGCISLIHEYESKKPQAKSVRMRFMKIQGGCSEMGRKAKRMREADLSDSESSDSDGEFTELRGTKPSDLNPTDRFRLKMDNYFKDLIENLLEFPENLPRDYETLKPREWIANFVLDDMIQSLINCYGYGARVVYLPSQLFQYIQRGIHLKEVANELFKQKAMSAEVVLVLCCTGTTNESAEHWVLGVIAKDQRTTYIMDSIEDKKCRKKVFKYLAVLLRMMYEIEQLSVPADWRYVYCEDCPIQRNNYDCGLYVVLYVFSILQGRRAPKPGRDIKSLDGRRWIYTHLQTFGTKHEDGIRKRRTNIPDSRLGLVLANAVNMVQSHEVETIASEKSNKIIRKLLHPKKK